MEQLSLLEQSRIELPAWSDEARVVEVAARIVEDLMLRPPVRLDVVASYQGIEDVRTEPSPWAGSLFVDGERLVIQVRSSDSAGRQRFSGFHEVGHTFLPGFTLATQFRCDPGGAPGEQARVEALCDLAAGELLLPRHFFRQDLVGAPFGMATVAVLADRYQASLEATALRFVDFWPEEALFVVLEVETKPSEPRALPRPRVRYAHGSGRWPFLPRHKSAADGSLLASVLDGGSVRGSSRLDGLVREFSEDVDLTAELFPFVDARGTPRDRILALYRRPGSSHGRETS
jgi:IrrE N-terminal-like domain